MDIMFIAECQGSGVGWTGHGGKAMHWAVSVAPRVGRHRCARAGGKMLMTACLPAEYTGYVPFP